MGNNKIIGAKIKNIRESKQLSIEEVAERSGLGIEQIERIEGNLDFPSLAPLIKIARVLGVRLGTFLDDQAELGPVVCRKRIARPMVSGSRTMRHKGTSIWITTRSRKISPAAIWNPS